MSSNVKIELSNVEIDTIKTCIMGAMQDCDELLQDYTGYLYYKITDDKMFLNHILEEIEKQLEIK